MDPKCSPGSCPSLSSSASPPVLLPTSVGRCTGFGLKAVTRGTLYEACLACCAGELGVELVGVDKEWGEQRRLVRVRRCQAHGQGRAPSAASDCAAAGVCGGNSGGGAGEANAK